MIKTPQEMLTEVRERMRGGEGNITIKNLFQADEIHGKVRLTAEITIPAGGSIGFHRHEQEEELFYFIAGQGIVDDNGITQAVGPGYAMLTGNGCGHSVRNAGNEPLVMLAVIFLYQ